MSSTISGSVSATLISMLGAVNTTANTVTRSVHTTASALDMLDQYVQDARIEQIARSTAKRDSMLQRIHEDTALEHAERQANLLRKLEADQPLAALYNENYETFKNETMAKIEAKLASYDQRISL